MFGFEMWQVAALVAMVLGTVLAVRYGFSKDDTIEDRRRHALAAAAELHKIGDHVLAGILDDYAIGDYSGVVKRVSDIVEQLMKPNGVVDMRADLVFAILPELLKGDKYDARLRKVIAQSISNHEFELTVAGEGAGPNGTSNGQPTPPTPKAAGTAAA